MNALLGIPEEYTVHPNYSDHNNERTMSPSRLAQGSTLLSLHKQREGLLSQIHAIKKEKHVLQEKNGEYSPEAIALRVKELIAKNTSSPSSIKESFDTSPYAPGKHTVDTWKYTNTIEPSESPNYVSVLPPQDPEQETPPELLPELTFEGVTTTNEVDSRGRIEPYLDEDTQPQKFNDNTPDLVELLGGDTVPDTFDDEDESVWKDTEQQGVLAAILAKDTSGMEDFLNNSPRQNTPRRYWRQDRVDMTPQEMSKEARENLERVTFFSQQQNKKIEKMGFKNFLSSLEKAKNVYRDMGIVKKAMLTTALIGGGTALGLSGGAVAITVGTVCRVLGGLSTYSSYTDFIKRQGKEVTKKHMLAGTALALLTSLAIPEACNALLKELFPVEKIADSILQAITNMDKNIASSLSLPKEIVGADTLSFVGEVKQNILRHVVEGGETATKFFHNNTFFPELSNLTQAQRENVIHNMLAEIHKDPKAYGLPSSLYLQKGEVLDVSTFQALLKTGTINGEHFIDHAIKIHPRHS